MALFSVVVVLLFGTYLASQSLRRPGIATGLMLAVFVVEQLVQSQFRFFTSSTLGMQGINLMLGAVVCSALVFGDCGSSPRYNFRGIPIIVLTFWFYMLAACFWSPAYEDAIRRCLKTLPYTLGMGILAPMCLRRPRDLLDFVDATAQFGAAVCLALMFAKYDRGGIVLLGAEGGRMANYLESGSYSSLVAVCAFAKYLGSRSSSETLAASAMGIVAICALLMSSARAALLALPFAMLTVVVLYPNSNPIKTLRRALGEQRRAVVTSVVQIIFLIALAVGAVSVLFPERLEFAIHRWDTDRVFGARYALEGRAHHALNLFDAYVSSPSAWLLGFGTAASNHMIGGYVHVVPVEVLCELGLAGFSVYGYLLYRGWRVSKLCRDLTQPVKLRGYVATVCGFFVVIALLQLKQGNAASIYTLSLVTVALAVAEMLQQPDNRNVAGRVGSNSRRESVTVQTVRMRQPN